MTRLFRASIILLFVLNLRAVDSNTFTNQSHGFSVTKPSKWVFVTAQEASDNMRSWRLGIDLNNSLPEDSFVPLVTITKYKEPYAGLNPSFTANAFPISDYDGDKPTSILDDLGQLMSGVVKDYREIMPPEEMELAGLKAAHLKYFCTMETTDGAIYPISTEIWVIPRGDFYFGIEVGISQTPSSEDQEEISRILKSIKFEIKQDTKQP